MKVQVEVKGKFQSNPLRQVPILGPPSCCLFLRLFGCFTRLLIFLLRSVKTLKPPTRILGSMNHHETNKGDRSPGRDRHGGELSKSGGAELPKGRVDPYSSTPRPTKQPVPTGS